MIGLRRILFARRSPFTHNTHKTLQNKHRDTTHTHSPAWSHPTSSVCELPSDIVTRLRTDRRAARHPTGNARAGRLPEEQRFVRLSCESEINIQKEPRISRCLYYLRLFGACRCSPPPRAAHQHNSISSPMSHTKPKTASGESPPATSAQGKLVQSLLGRFGPELDVCVRCRLSG